MALRRRSRRRGNSSDGSQTIEDLVGCSRWRPMNFKLSKKATQVHVASWLLGLLLAATTSCSSVAVSAGADAYDRKADRDRFEGRYAALNRSRRVTGKLPLDLCSERYWFERSWARKDDACAARIRRYENGDSTALDPPEERLQGTTETVPDSVQRVYDRLEEKRLQQQWKYGVRDR